MIVIDGLRFTPEAATVRRGERVTWVNKDLVPHTATAAGGAFDSQSVAPNASWTLVAEKAGTFPYTCTFHPNMKGTVTVQ